MFSQLTFWRSTFDSLLLRIFAVLVLLSLSLVPRLYQLTQEEPQPDELHWRMRSSEVLKRLDAGDYSHLTSHLGHPGIPPTFAMAAAQQSLSGRPDASFDQLGASRVGAASVSSLAPTVLFLGFAPVIGTLPSFAAAIFLALDPYHIGASRMAHLDGSLCLLLILTVVCYYRAVTNPRWWRYVIAGICWGLCILTKPTAVLMIPAILIWKAAERLCGNRKIRILDSRDLIVILVGHLVIAALFTRLWVHNSDYLRRLKIYTPVADFAYQTGLQLQNHPVFSVLMLAVLVVGGWLLLFARRQPSRGGGYVHYDLAVIWIIAVILLAALIAVPQVLENLVRFWWWVGGLSGQNHRAYGEIHQPPAGGYLVLLLSRVPSAVIVCGSVGAVWTLFEFRDRIRRRDHDFSRSSAAMLLLILLLVWGVFLSISSKQAYRYLLPAASAAAVLAGIGWSEIGAWLFSSSRGRKRPGRLLAWLVTAVVAAEVLSAAYLVFPHYSLYYSPLSGGLPNAVKRLSSLPVTGHLETVKYLDRQAAAAGHGLTVAVYGDMELLDFVQDHFLPERKHRLRFIFSSSLVESDYLAVFPFARKAVLGPVRKNLSEVFKFSVDQVVFVRLYKVAPFDFTEPYRIKMAHAGHTTGRVRTDSVIADTADVGKTGKAASVLLAVPAEHSKGFLLADTVRTNAGTYKLDFDLRLPSDFPPDPAITDERYAARLDYGKHCSRTITVGELRLLGEQALSLICRTDSTAGRAVRVYWFDTVPVEIKGVTIVSAGNPGSAAQSESVQPAAEPELRPTANH